MGKSRQRRASEPAPHRQSSRRCFTRAARHGHPQRNPATQPAPSTQQRTQHPAGQHPPRKLASPRPVKGRKSSGCTVSPYSSAKASVAASRLISSLSHSTPSWAGQGRGRARQRRRVGAGGQAAGGSPRKAFGAHARAGTRAPSTPPAPRFRHSPCQTARPALPRAAPPRQPPRCRALRPRPALAPRAAAGAVAARAPPLAHRCRQCAAAGRLDGLQARPAALQRPGRPAPWPGRPGAGKTWRWTPCAALPPARACGWTGSGDRQAACEAGRPIECQGLLGRAQQPS